MLWHTLPHAPASGTEVCLLAVLPPGSTRLFWFGPETGKRFGLLVSRHGDTVVAYVNRCAHFGVPLSETERHLIVTPGERITCNVHYARYHWQDGSCASGDCDGEPLLPVALRIEQGQIYIA